MHHVIARDLVVEFPIFGARSRSLKNTFIRAATGGQLEKDAGDRIVVRALDKVSFEFRDGDRIGLVGHNGSGKSTLLRVLAGAYEPVSGTISVSGKIASMLSITLGMDAEATGYENILLRGAIMGLKPAETAALVDDICEFSELGDFIDMPLRTYSSGMSMRLAFAVATSMQADIILMDEWLSAGDALFSAKAQERLNAIVDQAKILVLASHSPDVIRANCNRIIRLEHGRVDSEVKGGFKPRKVAGDPAEPTGSGTVQGTGTQDIEYGHVPMEERLRVWGLRGQPSYDENSLTTWSQSVDFLTDPKFISAYSRGMNSGHMFGGPGGSRDLNIRWRIAIYCWAARHASRLPGDFVDCGTNTGIFALAICEYIDFNSIDKNYWLFDTFEGIPVEQMSKGEAILGRQAENALWYAGSHEKAKRNFAAFPRAHIVKGKIPKSLNSVAIEQVALLCLDMNIAHPERAAIEHFWPRLAPGAIVICDNYGWVPYREQKLALDEFASRNGVEIMMLPTGQGLLIKP